MNVNDCPDTDAQLNAVLARLEAVREVVVVWEKYRGPDDTTEDVLKDLRAVLDPTEGDAP
jgi:hypothetical protein